jgi:hypothetical protein
MQERTVQLCLVYFQPHRDGKATAQFALDAPLSCPAEERTMARAIVASMMRMLAGEQDSKTQTDPCQICCCL